MTPSGSDLRRAVIRLTLQFTALIVVLLLVVSGLVYFIVSTSSAESDNRAMADAAQVDSPADASVGVLVTIIDNGQLQQSRDMPAGLPDQAALQQAAATGETVQSVVNTDGHTYAVQTTVRGDRVVQVAMDQHESSEELQRLFWALVISALIATLIAAAGSAWMARRSIRPLTEALDLQRRFVADASHELRTPLTLLSTRAQLLRRTVKGRPVIDSGEVTPAIDEIVQDSRVLTEILEDLLIAADPRESSERSPLDLCVSAEETVAALSARAAEHGLLLHRTGIGDGVIIDGARVSINRLFTALISNAIDHATSEVNVEITARASNAIIRISDDGPGFPPGMDDHAFERFASSRPVQQRITEPNETTGTPARHYGLGLALVAEVAARHGGSVHIEPFIRGRGAVIVVTLPAVS